MSDHIAEDQLTLLYYGETGDRAPQPKYHLAGCLACREAYQSLQRVLNSVDSFPVPDRGENYGQEVWIRPQAAAPLALDRMAGTSPLGASGGTRGARPVSISRWTLHPAAARRHHYGQRIASPRSCSSGSRRRSPRTVADGADRSSQRRPWLRGRPHGRKADG